MHQQGPNLCSVGPEAQRAGLTAPKAGWGWLGPNLLCHGETMCADVASSSGVLTTSMCSGNWCGDCSLPGEGLADMSQYIELGTAGASKLLDRFLTNHVIQRCFGASLCQFRQLCALSSLAELASSEATTVIQQVPGLPAFHSAKHRFEQLPAVTAEAQAVDLCSLCRLENFSARKRHQPQTVALVLRNTLMSSTEWERQVICDCSRG